MGNNLIKAVDVLFKIMEYAILARVLITWLPIPRDNQIIRLLYQITEPILGPVRNIVNKSALGRNMMIDFSPVIAFLIIGLVRNIIIEILWRNLL